MWILVAAGGFAKGWRWRRVGCPFRVSPPAESTGDQSDDRSVKNAMQRDDDDDDDSDDDKKAAKGVEARGGGEEVGQVEAGAVASAGCLPDEG